MPRKPSEAAKAEAKVHSGTGGDATLILGKSQLWLNAALWEGITPKAELLLLLPKLALMENNVSLRY